MHNCLLITLPIQSCLLLHTFYTSLLHSFIIRLIISSVSPHWVYLPYCCFLSMFALKYFIFIVLFWAVISHTLWVFLTSCRWWYFSRVWEAVNLLWSQYFGRSHQWRSRFVHRFPTLLVPSPSLWGPFQTRQIQLVLPLA